MAANCDHIMDERIKKTDIDRDEIFQKYNWYALFNHKRNEKLLEELNEEPVDQRLIRYKSNWLRYVTRISNKMPKIMLNFRQMDEDDLEDL